MFIGNFESFRFTAAADTPVDTIVTAGALIGVTKDNVANGEEGLAFMGIARNVFSLPIEALAAAQTHGALVYITSGGALSFTSTDNTPFGILWADAASGATDIQVALN